MPASTKRGFTGKKIGMTAIDVIETLLAQSERLPGPEQPWLDSPRQVAQSHLRHLARILALPNWRDFEGEIQSSWRTIVAAGRKHGLFARLSGNAEARAAIQRMLALDA
jgi:hypothetical protein